MTALSSFVPTITPCHCCCCSCCCCCYCCYCCCRYRRFRWFFCCAVVAVAVVADLVLLLFLSSLLLFLVLLLLLSEAKRVLDLMITYVINRMLCKVIIRMLPDPVIRKPDLSLKIREVFTFVIRVIDHLIQEFTNIQLFLSVLHWQKLSFGKLLILVGKLTFVSYKRCLSLQDILLWDLFRSVCVYLRGGGTFISQV